MPKNTLIFENSNSKEEKPNIKKNHKIIVIISFLIVLLLYLHLF